MGVGLSAPTTAVRGDTGLVPPACRQYQEVAKQYARITHMSPDRINHKVLSRRSQPQEHRDGRVPKMLTTSINIITENVPQNKNLQCEVSDAARQQFLHDWEMELNRVNAKRGHGLNKLRTYKLLNMNTAWIAM